MKVLPTIFGNYIAKNEVNASEKYDKKLFVRLFQGMYLPNPLMEIFIAEHWIDVYDLIDIDEIENQARYKKGFIGLIKNYRKQLEKNPDKNIDPRIYWQSA